MAESHYSADSAAPPPAHSLSRVLHDSFIGFPCGPVGHRSISPVTTRFIG